MYLVNSASEPVPITSVSQCLFIPCPLIKPAYIRSAGRLVKSILLRIFRSWRTAVAVMHEHQDAVELR